MTVTSVAEIADGRDTSEVSIAGVAEARHTRVFRIVTNNRHDADLDILGASGVPKDGDVHPDDPIAFIRARNAVMKHPPFVWEMKCRYSTGREISNNPLADPAIITWNTEQFQKSFIEDTNGNAVLNSAGDPFDPPHIIDDARWAVSVRKNVSGVPPAILSYREAINSNAFTIQSIPVGIRRAKISSIHIGEVQYRNSNPFLVFSYILQLKDSTEDDWRPRLLDQGLYEIDGVDRKPILDKDKEPVTTPKQLDGAGAAVADPTILTAVFGTFPGNRELNFNVLPMT